MKKLLPILFILLCGANNASAQKIHFTDTSNVWKELESEYNAPYPPILFYSTFSFIGDTVIDAAEYRHFGFGLVREDTTLNKVYIRDVTGDSDIVLMDYNLNVGDSFNNVNNHFAVTNIDSTLINSTWYKVWYFTPIYGGIYGGDPIAYIEGIGCIEHPTYMFWNFSGCVECTQPLMYCFSNNGVSPTLSPPVSFLDDTTSCNYFATLNTIQIQSDRKGLIIYPNPTNAELTIASTQPIYQITIINLLGQIVYQINGSKSSSQIIDVSGLNEGVYFIKVNNVMVKRFLKE